jgi:UDP-2,4-diacetamido-2,4,6-trideoxy-beta-L-altropyranose hydrolase
MTACTDAAMRERLSAAGFEVRGAEELGRARRTGDWLVLDGYHFATACQQRAREAGWRVLVIDDTAHLDHYAADAILNQNIAAERCVYSHEPYTRLLLGPRYALLRREFRRWRACRRDFPRVARKLLITLGGSDPQHISLRVIEAVRQVAMDDLEAVVVAGAQYEAREELAVAAQHANVRVESKVEDMAPLMAWADMAVSAAGSTCWELAFLGVPSILIVVAGNQREIAAGLAAQGCAANLGTHDQVSTADIATTIQALALDHGTRAAWSKQAAALVDGMGAQRVTRFLET